MGQNYGVSFASKLIDDGKYEEAIVAAQKDIDRDGDDPEPVLDLAVAQFQLERFADAVSTLERAIDLDVKSQTLDDDLVDDTLFGALLGEARRTSDVAAAVAQLERYRKVLPRGRHLPDVTAWSARLRGEGTHDVIVKDRS